MINFETVKTDYHGQSAQDVLKSLIKDIFPGRIAMVSSFGAESAVLLHMVSEIDKTTPVIFLNTGKLFAETLVFQTQLSKRLGLTDVRVIDPAKSDLDTYDEQGNLWESDTDACCHIRKVLPMEEALKGFQAWITGRKRFQGGIRTELPMLETADWRLKVNPLAGWPPEQVEDYLTKHDLPRHPLVAEGYRSIGCIPCTIPAGGSDARSGRWANQEKVECGIHWSANGKPTALSK